MSTLKIDLVIFSALLLATSSASIISKLHPKDQIYQEVFEVTSARDFETSLTDAGPQLVVALFCSDTKTECSSAGKTFKRMILKKFGVVLLKVDEDKLKDVSDKYIRMNSNLPKFVVFKDGTPVAIFLDTQTNFAMREILSIWFPRRRKEVDQQIIYDYLNE